MNPEAVLDVIQDHVDEGEVLSERRVVAHTDRERYRDALQELWDEGVTHLVTITGTDLGDETELIYHVSCGDGVILDLTFEVPEEDRKVSTITDIFPSAVLHELEIRDLLGVEVQDHPNPRPLILPDDWPKHKRPLKKGMYDYRKLAEEPVSEIKEIAEDEDFDPQIMLEVEEENKNRKSLKEWLKKQIEKSEEEE